MQESKHKLIKHCHTNGLFHIFNSIYYCVLCSSFIIINSSSESQLKTIKPENFAQNSEILPCPLWTSEEKTDSTSFLNKKGYIKERSPIIKYMKDICTLFALSLKTYFLSVAYVDKISSKISSFNQSYLVHISLLCIILAAKFNEQGYKALQLKNSLTQNISKNYSIDEIYVLQLLNYKLNMHTSYDMILDIKKYGFIFEGENFNYRKINYIFSIPEKILYIFSEINSYLDMTEKQTAVCIIGFARELLGLMPFNENIKKIFCINSKNEKIYNSGLKIIKKKIKIECGPKKEKNEVNINFDDKGKKNGGINDITNICNNYNKLVE